MAMKIRPFRHKLAGKHILREQMVAKIAKSPAGMRVVRECQTALALPVNSDVISRRLVVGRYADELDLFPHEMEELLERIRLR